MQKTLFCFLTWCRLSFGARKRSEGGESDQRKSKSEKFTLHNTLLLVNIQVITARREPAYIPSLARSRQAGRQWKLKKGFKTPPLFRLVPVVFICERALGLWRHNEGRSRFFNLWLDSFCAVSFLAIVACCACLLAFHCKPCCRETD